MDELDDELLLKILEFTDSSIEYKKICESLGRVPYIPHMLKVHSRVEVDEKGTIRTYFDGKLHSFNDEPAVIFTDGSKVWYKDGKRHRDDDKPAVIWTDGDIFWYKDDKLHRDGDEPAVIYGNGEKRWYKDGEFIRSRDPLAVI